MGVWTWGGLDWEVSRLRWTGRQYGVGQGFPVHMLFCFDGCYWTAWRVTAQGSGLDAGMDRLHRGTS